MTDQCFRHSIICYLLAPIETARVQGVVDGGSVVRWGGSGKNKILVLLKSRGKNTQD